MTGVTFSCPRCDITLEATTELVGQLTDCPNCQSAIEVPSFLQLRQQAAARHQSTTTRQCPCCGENILRVAIKCKHCGSDLGGLGGSTKRILPALLLCLFLGYLGIHAFYAGKAGQGIIYLVLCLAMVVLISLGSPFYSIFGLALSAYVVVDFVRIVVGVYKDGNGEKITQWT